MTLNSPSPDARPRPVRTALRDARDFLVSVETKRVVTSARPHVEALARQLGRNDDVTVDDTILDVLNEFAALNHSDSQYAMRALRTYALNGRVPELRPKAVRGALACKFMDDDQAAELAMKLDATTGQAVVQPVIRRVLDDLAHQRPRSAFAAENIRTLYRAVLHVRDQQLLGDDEAQVFQAIVEGHADPQGETHTQVRKLAERVMAGRELPSVDAGQEAGV